MNIQQALNQALVATGTSIYLTGQTIDRGRETSTAKYREASDADRAKNREYEDLTSKVYPVMKRRGLSEAEMKETVDATSIGQEKAETKDVRDRAEKEMRKWYWTSEKPDDLVKLYDTKDNEEYKGRLQDAFNEAIALMNKRDSEKSVKSVASLKNKQETAANTNAAVQERIDMLRKISHSHYNPNPSVMKEE